MGLKKLFVSFLLLGLLSAAAILYMCPELMKEREKPTLEDEWWGRGPVPTDITKVPKDNTAVKKYAVNINDSVLKDLKSRLANTRFVDPLDNVHFEYGFHSSYLKEVVEYWRTKYDWRKHEKDLNKFDHFITQIEGIDVHFIHQKPNLQGKKLRVLPLLLVHGWPGSVYEFYKIIPLLTTPREGKDYVFEVICPSIPGYGFSEAPHQPGFSAASGARVFMKLMDRLGHKKFYAQGGDWGSFISTIISIAYPERVLGVHVNMAPLGLGLPNVIRHVVGHFIPSLIITSEDRTNIYPLKPFLTFLLEEMGYSHIQMTKPDTVGSALADSPAGLAAYIMEKFSTWTDKSNRELPDGGLEKKFTRDELLTNVMIYWCTNSIASSQRFYKEVFNKKMLELNFDSHAVKVPAGISIFPNELVVPPRSFVENKYKNIVHYTRMPRGGHFAAFEEPKIFADELWDFVINVESAEKKQKK